MDSREPRRRGGADFHKLALLSSAGLILPSSIAVGLFFGYLLDKLLGTGPWLLLVFFFLGVVSGFLSLFRALRKIRNDKEDDG
jgi:ATP synthase protein I